MRMIKAAMLVSAGLVGLLITSAAKAATITENLTFNLTGFIDVNGTQTPPDPTITGFITVTYDPTLTYNSDTNPADIVVHSLTGVTVDSPLGFTYSAGFFEFGGTQTGSNFILAGTNDLAVSFNLTDPAHPTFITCATPGYNCLNDTGNPLIDASGYSTANSNDYFFYGAQSTVAPTPPAAVTPEPSSLVLLGTGVTALAGMIRRRTSQLG
jgi:hypothetical protein